MPSGYCIVVAFWDDAQNFTWSIVSLLDHKHTLLLFYFLALLLILLIRYLVSCKPLLLFSSMGNRDAKEMKDRSTNWPNYHNKQQNQEREGRNQKDQEEKQ